MSKHTRIGIAIYGALLAPFVVIMAPFWAAGYLHKKMVGKKDICTIPHCDSPKAYHEYCEKHYLQERTQERCPICRNQNMIDIFPAINPNASPWHPEMRADTLWCFTCKKERYRNHRLRKGPLSPFLFIL